MTKCPSFKIPKFRCHEYEVFNSILFVFTAQAITNGDPLQAYAAITPYGISEYLSKWTFCFCHVIYMGKSFQDYYRTQNFQADFP